MSKDPNREISDLLAFMDGAADDPSRSSPPSQRKLDGFFYQGNLCLVNLLYFIKMK